MYVTGKHPVSALGELCNKRRWNQPKYDIVHESGPAHDKTFKVKLSLNGDILAEGEGKSKKEAEQKAAREAYHCLQGKSGL